MTSIEDQYLLPKQSKDDIHARKALLNRDNCNLRGYLHLICNNQLVIEQITWIRKIKSHKIIKADTKMFSEHHRWLLFRHL